MTFKFGSSEIVLSVLQTDKRVVFCMNLVIVDYWLNIKLSIKDSERSKIQRPKESQREEKHRLKKNKLKYNYDYCP